MQGRRKGPNRLHPVLCQPEGDHLTQVFQTGLLVIIDCLRLGPPILTEKARGKFYLIGSLSQVSKELIMRASFFGGLKCNRATDLPLCT